MSIELQGDGGSLSVATGALVKIVAQAAEAVDGVRVLRPRRRVEVALEDGAARVALTLSLAYGRVIPEASRQVQERVADALETMCGCRASTVDVSIEELDE